MHLPRRMAILEALRGTFLHLRQVLCCATAQNALEKTDFELRYLNATGHSLLYFGPESGDQATLRRIVKGATFDDHTEAARKVHAAGMKISAIVLLGAGGVERTADHARETARLVTEMDSEYLAALTLAIVPGTSLHRMVGKGRFKLPSVPALLQELRTIVAEPRPMDALFRTNHASSYLPIAGRLPHDREQIVTDIDAALDGEIPLRPEFLRGL